MKIWLPYIKGGSGTDVFTETLAAALNARGLHAVAARFAHNYQYAPWLLYRKPAPPGTDVVLANTWNAFAFKQPNIPLVAVEHLLVLDPALAAYRSCAQGLFHQLFVRHYERATHAAADQVVAVSRYTADRYRDALRVTPPRVILNGIDTDFFQPKLEAGEPVDDRPLRLLFVGNMSRRKGSDLLPEILSALGEGFELSYTLGLRVDDPFPELPDTRRLGRLDSRGVRDEYRRADLLLLPTRLEGLPLAAMEAMACGTPVVASNTASLPEVIDHGVTGILCPLNDSASFAQAIRELRGDPLRCRQMGMDARLAAQRRFSMSRMVDEYVSLFFELLQQ